MVIPILPLVRTKRPNNSPMIFLGGGSSHHISPVTVPDANPNVPWLVVLIRIIEPLANFTTGAPVPRKPLPRLNSTSGCSAAGGMRSNIFFCRIRDCSQLWQITQHSTGGGGVFRYGCVPKQ